MLSISSTLSVSSGFATYRFLMFVYGVLFLPQLLLVHSNGVLAAASEYLGKPLGRLSQLHHGLAGQVFAVDERTLYIKDFTYDGQGPAAYFYASHSKPDASGFRIKDELGRPYVLRKYRKEGVTITLPEGKTIRNIRVFYVWCEEFSVSFGDVKIPADFEYPRPQKIDALNGVHNIASDNIVIVDAQTLLIPNFSYDGEAPDAKFWVGAGRKPSPQGIRVADENGKMVPLRRYDHKTIVLTLPGELTIFDIGHFGVWCEAFTVDFGHVQIPSYLNVPPSLKMLGVSPQSKLNCEVLYEDLAFEVRWAIAGDSIVLQLVGKLDENEYMSFGLSANNAKSVMEGGDVVVAWVDQNTLKGYAQDYFLESKSQCSGPTGSCPDTRFAEKTNNIRLLNAAMVNGYSIVTYQRPLKAADHLDLPIYTNHTQPIIWAIGPLNQRNEVSFHTYYPKATDNFIQFGRTPRWNCPMPENDQQRTTTTATTHSPSRRPPTQQYQYRDTEDDEIDEDAIDESYTLRAPSHSTTTTTLRTTSMPQRSNNNFRRRGNSAASQRVNAFSTSQPAAQEVSHGRTRGRTNLRGSNHISRSSTTSTTTTTTTTSTTTPTPVSIATPASAPRHNAWDIPAIQCYEPEDGVFYAQMGPTGGKHGYPAITGHVGWGICWYINGLLIPEIHVVRGKTYTFVVEGGFDPEVAAKYHPFYITDDPVGGYEYKTDEEKSTARIFAGAIFGKNGITQPTGVGRLCHWTQTGDLDADDFESFGAYQRTLELKCDPGEPGVIQWTPDEDTPDLVYYQCFTHRYLGWKIHVHDRCDYDGASSEIRPQVIASPDRERRQPQTSRVKKTSIHNTNTSNHYTASTNKPKNDIIVVSADTTTITTSSIDSELNADSSINDDPVSDKSPVINEPPLYTLSSAPPTSHQQSHIGLAPPSPLFFSTPILQHYQMHPFMSHAPVLQTAEESLPQFATSNYAHHPPPAHPPPPPKSNIIFVYKKNISQNKYRKPYPSSSGGPVFIRPPAASTIYRTRPRKPYRTPIRPPTSNMIILASKPPTTAVFSVKMPPSSSSPETSLPPPPPSSFNHLGFRADSIAFETGFTPIISHNALPTAIITKRMDINEPNETESTSATAKTVNASTAMPQNNEFFEPIFVPSRLEPVASSSQLHATATQQNPLMGISTNARSHRRRSREHAPHIVIAHDGTRLSGSTLTGRQQSHQLTYSSSPRTERLADFVRSRPAFVLYQGDSPAPPPPSPFLRNTKSSTLQQTGQFSSYQNSNEGKSLPSYTALKRSRTGPSTS